MARWQAQRGFALPRCLSMRWTALPLQKRVDAIGAAQVTTG